MGREAAFFDRRDLFGTRGHETVHGPEVAIVLPSVVMEVTVDSRVDFHADHVSRLSRDFGKDTRRRSKPRTKFKYHAVPVHQSPHHDPLVPFDAAKWRASELRARRVPLEFRPRALESFFGK